jgi:hypothetical protein
VIRILKTLNLEKCRRKLALYNVIYRSMWWNYAKVQSTIYPSWWNVYNMQSLCSFSFCRECFEVLCDHKGRLCRKLIANFKVLHVEGNITAKTINTHERKVTDSCQYLWSNVNTWSRETNTCTVDYSLIMLKRQLSCA